MWNNQTTHYQQQTILNIHHTKGIHIGFPMIIQVKGIIDSIKYIMGLKVEELERKIAEYLRVKFAIGV